MSDPARRLPAVVVGGGVLGCAVLWRLAARAVDALLVESELDVGEGASKANSGILHTGFDSTPGSAESRFLRRAAELWPEVLEELRVPWLRVGALMLARTPEERRRLRDEIGPRAGELGVTAELLEGRELRELAPYVTEKAVAALSVPDESVIDPFWLTRAYAEAALAAGARVLLGRRVVSLRAETHGLRVRLDDGLELRAAQVFDCAGLWADEVARMAGDASFAIAPRKGQFLVSEEAFGVDRIVLPIPGPLGKGMLVTPIVFGGLLLGPTAEDQEDKGDRSTDPATGGRILEGCSALVPAVAAARAVRSFAGLRTVSSTGVPLVRPSSVTDRLFIVAGVRSTGLSASPAIAEQAVAEAARLRGWQRPRHPIGAIPPERVERPTGRIVCLCRSVSQGEVEAACRGILPALSLDGLKRRSGALFGDCQGNLCAVETAAILAAEHGTSIDELGRSRPGSTPFRAAPALRGRPGPSPLRGEPSSAAEGSGGWPSVDAGTIVTEVVVVGAGRAGTGAADALMASGVPALVLEHRARIGGDALTWDAEERAAVASLTDARSSGIAVLTRWTAVGLARDEGVWTVLAQGAPGTLEIRTRAVVIATGGYVMPREHRAIAGPRPAGILTSDLLERATEAGLAIGSEAVVVGRGRTAEAACGRLEATGCRVVARFDECAVDEVRGATRLSGIRAGGAWWPCDTLVLADRLLPAPWILRGLGLLDMRPGVAAPAGPDGRLGLPGLWAVGTCVEPDIDHRGSLDSGRRVGARLAAELREGRLTA